MLNRREIIKAIMAIPIAAGVSGFVTRGAMASSDVDVNRLYQTLPRNPAKDVEHMVQRVPFVSNVQQIFVARYGMSSTCMATKGKQRSIAEGMILRAGALKRLLEDVNVALHFGLKRISEPGDTPRARYTGGLDWMRKKRINVPLEDLRVMVLRPISHRETTDPAYDGFEGTFTLECGLGTLVS